MATNLELKVQLAVLKATLDQMDARIKKLEQQTLRPDAPPVEIAEKKSERKMCPKCGVKPNHFFHVKTCTGAK
jgi:hypothetical protein